MCVTAININHTGESRLRLGVYFLLRSFCEYNGQLVNRSFPVIFVFARRRIGDTVLVHWTGTTLLLVQYSCVWTVTLMLPTGGFSAKHMFCEFPIDVLSFSDCILDIRRALFSMYLILGPLLWYAKLVDMQLYRRNKQNGVGVGN